MANRLVCFPSRTPYAACFLELLAVEQPDAVPDSVMSFVGHQLGPLAIVFAVPDLDACQRRLSQHGASGTGPLKIRRQWVLSSDHSLDVAQH